MEQTELLEAILAAQVLTLAKTISIQKQLDSGSSDGMIDAINLIRQHRGTIVQKLFETPRR